MNLKAIVAIGLILSAAGCSHYQLGTRGTLSFQTLYVEPIANRTSLPQARALVSTTLREEFLRNGRVALVNSAAEADAILTVALTDYHRDVATVRPDDTGLARKFALTLGATVTLRDNHSGKVFFEKRAVHVVRDAYTDNGLLKTPGTLQSSDQLQSEYQTLPLLAESLAGRVAHTVLDVW